MLVVVVVVVVVEAVVVVVAAAGFLLLQYFCNIKHFHSSSRPTSAKPKIHKTILSERKSEM